MDMVIVKITLDGNERMVPAKDVVLCDAVGNPVATMLEPILDCEAIEVTSLDSPCLEFISDGLLCLRQDP